MKHKNTSNMKGINDANITYDGVRDPKDHMVQCSITVSANDYEAIKSALPTKYFDELELKRELSIMNEVRKMPGYSMIDKVNNAIDTWSHEKQTTVRGNVRYQLKYKY